MPTHWHVFGTSVILKLIKSSILQKFFNNLLGLITTRLLLLFEELAQVRDALFSILLWGIGAVVFLSFGLIALSALFVIYTWPLLGLGSLALLSGLFWLIASVFVVKIWRAIKQDKLKLKITSEELRMDREVLFPKDVS